MFSNRHSNICPQIAPSVITESEPKAFSHIALVIFAIASFVSNVCMFPIYLGAISTPLLLFLSYPHSLW